MENGHLTGKQFRMRMHKQRQQQESKQAKIKKDFKQKKGDSSV